MKRLSIFTLLTVLTGLMIPAASAQTSTTPFPDVQSQHVNVDAIDYLKDEGIIEGYPDGQYKPSLNINRAEFSKIIVGAIVENPQGTNCFSDVQDQWFAKYVCQAEQMGIVDGYPDGSFKPAENINFSEAAKIIANAYEKDAQDLEGERWFKEYVDALAEEKAIPFSVNFFDEKVTRDEMAEMIYRLKADVKTKATRTYTEITADEFVTVDSCEAVVERIRANETYYRYGFGGGMEVLEERAMTDSAEGDTGSTAEPTAAPSPGGSDGSAANQAESAPADDYSSTNIQVAGVDEADIIKNDGKYIYLLKNGTIRIVDAYPADEMEELVTLTLGEEGEQFWPTEMYVDGDTLVAIGSVWRDDPVIMESESTAEMSMIMPYYYQNRVRVYVLDITDRTAPTISRTVDFDGSYSTSRKVGDTLYTVMNQYAYYPYHFYENPELYDPARIIPHMLDSAEGSEELVAPCRDIRIFPKDQRNNFLITAAIPLTNMDAPVSRNVLVGSADNVYASRKNMYVTATDWSGGWERTSFDTAIYRFALGINSIQYQDRGKVPGTVLNQFSMDEYQDNFRIATTTGGWEGDSSNNMYVLNQNMDLIGSLEDIAPGESIFSVRFTGNKAYMVTFLRVDPLFVIGLEDPTNPTILGELKIPGFSNYLHPFDENHLIGFGKEVDPGDSDIDDDDFVLWNQVQGLKVGLFDVSDVNNPKELYTEVIGDQGTDSQLLYNHKALLFDKEKELLAFPISVYEYEDESSCQDYTYSSCPSDCRQICEPSSCTFNNGILVCTPDCDGENSCVPQELRYGQKTFEGAYVYNLNLEDGFTLEGKINHHDAEDLADLADGGWVDYQKAIERIIYIGENLYTISQWGVKANLLEDLSEELNFIELAGNYNYGDIIDKPIPL